MSTLVFPDFSFLSKPLTKDIDFYACPKERSNKSRKSRVQMEPVSLAVENAKTKNETSG